MKNPSPVYKKQVRGLFTNLCEKHEIHAFCSTANKRIQR